MKAIRYEQYGPPEVLRLCDVETPAPGEDEILVRVRASGVNPLDVHFLHGTPYVVRTRSGLRRPSPGGLGADVAGRVEAAGARVTAFRPGDEVFGACDPVGAFAEFVVLPADGAVLTSPAGLTAEQAAAVPVAGFTALQAIRDKGRVEAGQSVLVNGAAGGVGTFAVQIAKAFGATVTGVCSSRNVALVREIGADHAVDYTTEDFVDGGRRYDVLIDCAGSRTLAECRRALTPSGVLVAVGGPVRGKWVRPLLGPLKLMALNPFTGQTLAPMLARNRRDDLAVLRDLLEAGTVTPVLDRTYPLAEAAAAVRHVEAGHARGKVVVTTGA